MLLQSILPTLATTNQKFDSCGTLSATTMLAESVFSGIDGASNYSLLNGALLSSFANNPIIIGTAWMISSAVFTTYSTTKFIKYKNDDSTIDISPNPLILQKIVDQIQPLKVRLRYEKILHSSIFKLKSIIRPIKSKLEPHRGTNLQVSSTNDLQQQRPILLSPSSRLTMYRFAGSLVFGLLFSTSSTNIWSISQRLYDTIEAIPALLLPSMCLFIANFSNTYVRPFILFVKCITRTFTNFYPSLIPTDA
jgi:hypothetical protein